MREQLPELVYAAKQLSDPELFLVFKAILIVKTERGL